MIQFLVAAPCSGSGKTTLTCALLAALKRRRQDPCSFKSGPDYIDPMFHRAVLGVESHNLDLFFSAPETVRALYAQAAAGLENVLEVMVEAEAVHQHIAVGDHHQRIANTQPVRPAAATPHAAMA